MPDLQLRSRNSRAYFDFVPFSQLCWEKCGLRNSISTGIDVSLQFTQVFESLKNQELEMICTVAWKIWDHRNSVVWNHGKRTPTLVVNGASSTIFQWQQAQGNKQLDSDIKGRE